MSAEDVVSVAVVATDEWMRRGLTHALVEDTRTNLVASLDHDDAVAGPLPPQLGALVVDSCGPLDRWDRVAGVAVARRAVQAPGPGPVVVALVPDDPLGAIRRRMLEAGAALVVGRRALRSVDDLVAALRAPEARPAMPIGRTDRLSRLGVTSRSRLNDGLDFIVTHGLEHHFEGAQPDLSRRQLITLRGRLNAVLRLDPVGEGSSAVVERTTPSWRQIRAVVDSARGAELGDHALH
ncbi:MAG TPA: hypothetical protein VK507_11275 [Iamia sp.]|nr:hypothetical protein [Iamia sp.]